MSIPKITPTSPEEPKLPKNVPAKIPDNKTESLGKKKLEGPKTVFFPQKGLKDMEFTATNLTDDITSYYPENYKDYAKELEESLNKTNKKVEPEKKLQGITRLRNSSFFGDLTNEQVVAELGKLSPGQAIFYKSKEKNTPMISYLESGKLENKSIDEANQLIDANKITMVKPNFAEASKSNEDQLKENEAIVSYQNGYSFVTEKTAEGIEYSNIFGAGITHNEKLKIYSTIEDIKNKLFYFGEISSSEADELLSQQMGPSILVRRDEDNYYLQERGNDPQGKEFYHTQLLSKKSDTLVESRRLLELEAKLDFKSKQEGRSIIEIPVVERPSEKASSKPNSLLFKTKAFSQGFRTRAVAFAKRFFSSSVAAPVVKAPISSAATERLIAKRDWGEMEQSVVEKILENSKDGQSILWRDQGRIMVSLKRGEQVELHSFNSPEEYLKSVRGLGLPKPPPAYDEFAEEELIQKEKNKFEEEMFFVLGTGDLSDYIQRTLENNPPEKKALIIEALTSLRNEDWAEAYYSTIDEQLDRLRLG